MALSQEVLKILIVALADKEAGEELFAAINGGLAISSRTLKILIVSMANEPAARGFARAIENKIPISERILTILIVAMANRNAGLAIENQLELNQIISNLTGIELFTACNDAYNACFAQYELDNDFNLAGCNAASWAQLEPNYNVANKEGFASCSADSGTSNDWFCAMDPTLGFGSITDVPMVMDAQATDNVGTECFIFVETFHSQTRTVVELGKLISGVYTRIPVNTQNIVNNGFYSQNAIWDSVIGKFVVIFNGLVISITTAGVVEDITTDFPVANQMYNSTVVFSEKGGGRHYIWDDFSNGVRSFNVVTQSILVASQVPGHAYCASTPHVMANGNILKTQNGSIQIVDPSVELPEGYMNNVLAPVNVGADDAVGGAIYLEGPDHIVVAGRTSFSTYTSAGVFISTTPFPFVGSYVGPTFEDPFITKLTSTDFIVYRATDPEGLQMARYSGVSLIASATHASTSTNQTHIPFRYNAGKGYISSTFILAPSTQPVLLDPATLAYATEAYDDMGHIIVSGYDNFGIRTVSSAEAAAFLNDCTGGPHFQIPLPTEPIFTGADFWTACNACAGDPDCFNAVHLLAQNSVVPTELGGANDCQLNPGFTVSGDWACNCNGADCSNSPQSHDCTVP